MVSCGKQRNNLNKYKMKLDEIISNYTHHIIDLNENSWKVIETSDIEEICKEYHKQQLTIGGVVKSLPTKEEMLDENSKKVIEIENSNKTFSNHTPYLLGFSLGFQKCYEWLTK